MAELDAVHVVTNAHKAAQFERWAAGRDVTVHDDGTTSNDGRLGAIGDIAFVLERTGLDDDLLVIAGDNLFTFSLADLVAFWRSKGVASAVAVHDVGSTELARKYGVVALDSDDRVVDFLEKPEDPPSTLAASCPNPRTPKKLVVTFSSEIMGDAVSTFSRFEFDVTKMILGGKVVF